MAEVNNLGGAQNGQLRNHSVMEKLSSSGVQDINERLQIFFAELAADAGMSLEELMDRSRASRKVNEAKRAYQAKGVQDKNSDFVYGTNEDVIDVWLSTYADKVGDNYVPRENPQGYTGYTQDDVTTMLNLRTSMNADNKLDGKEKETLDNIMDLAWTVDENGQPTISDEMMTMTLQQANGLYQSMINGNRAMISAQIDLLRELIRALGG